MAFSKKPLAALAAMALAATLAACGGGDSDDKPGGGTAEAGGNAIFLNGPRNTEHWDPQRMYIGRDLNNSGRLFYRSLVAFPASNDATEGTTPVPDLATDTGTTEDGGKTWKFTIRDDVKWEDGKPITCEDFAYGASRNFATDVIIGGPANYLFTYLDIPSGDDGLPQYKGPYTGKGQELFDKAVSCDGQTITYKMKKAWPDFPQSAASLRYLDPYRKDLDKGDANNFTIISNGPYKLDGQWKEGTGGKFVRNENWDASTDSIRKAYPDTWEFREGDSDEAIYEQFLADSGDAQYAVTERRMPPSFYSRIKEAGDRYSRVESPYVDYVLPNFNSPVFKDANCREALKLATNKTAWIKAGGGEKAYTPAYSVVNPNVPGYKENPAFADVPDEGDVDAAKAALAKCSAPKPVKIKFTYSGGTPTSDNQAAALKESWDAAGFSTELDPLEDTYYSVIQKPDADFDVTWGGWGADWPSIGTVIPPLFDSRINLTGDSNGNDYGNYKGGPEVDKLIDDAYAESDLDKAADKWAAVDAKLGEDVAYIPLEITIFNFVHGGKITGYANNISVNGYADLAVIGVEK
ncbi:ABC transporter substrate-binding protein [Nocardioides sp. zg-536]|uniref:ABC transporter substrate-binding protein n=1 Tax=Nocardioides faecalis TaxID=2803858 RepID=A0A938XZ02_9ACTN|nr:ABC transporter substrate-binding protein [Nocardioides faecalis]MBM9458806.1 ABC transporter substrate-binding protein [Nocardioides faecalis]MBS4754101.1 ABC transporter substrate-binding protein [Nocardioides faecalis]QVI60220.1 ABC transporter substrate-binding protein [Nocardioides faecalis]